MQKWRPPDVCGPLRAAHLWPVGRSLRRTTLTSSIKRLIWAEAGIGPSCQHLLGTVQVLAQTVLLIWPRTATFETTPGFSPTATKDSKTARTRWSHAYIVYKHQLDRLRWGGRESVSLLNWTPLIRMFVFNPGANKPRGQGSEYRLCLKMGVFLAVSITSWRIISASSSLKSEPSKEGSEWYPCKGGGERMSSDCSVSGNYMS